MKDKSLSYELIEKYFEGRASDEEIKTYELRLQIDSVFANDVHQYIALRKGFSMYSKRKALKKQLNQIHQAMEENTPKPKLEMLLSYWKPMLVAAAVAIIFSWITHISLNKFKQNTDQKSHYKALEKDLEKVKKAQNLLWKSINTEEAASESLSGGTGVAIATEGLILTDYHVIQNAKQIVVANTTWGSLPVKVIYSNPALDIAVLKIDAPTFKRFKTVPYMLRVKKMKLGEKVFTLGYPNDDIVFGEGYISSLNGYEGDTVAYQMSIPVNPGNSGGPLMDEKGNLVGIISGKHAVNEGAGFALKGDKIARDLKAVSDSLAIHLPTQNQLHAITKMQLIEKIQPFVFSVRVAR